MTNDSIFVQIACYRDPDIYDTLNDMVINASNPENLHICIAWQNSKSDSWENKDKLIGSAKNVEIIDIDFMDSKGVCWARNMVQGRYSGQKYTLQIDSHHRFVEGWDSKLIDMIESLRVKGYDKPLLTAYAPSFNPDTYPEGREDHCWKMNFDRFIPEGAVFFLPARFDVWDDTDNPVPARFYSAHFAFADGCFSQEVMHDPEFYFHGEEISIAVRAFTHGYDLFHPNEIITWHEYTRKNRTKHWDDHYNWTKSNTKSHKRNRMLLGVDGQYANMNLFGNYGFGEKRTVRQYEKYAGICFSDRSITQDVVDKIPPNIDDINMSDENFQSKLTAFFKHCIDLDKTKFTEQDYDFWAVIFQDSEGNEIYRKDADIKEIDTLLKDDNYIKLWREFNDKKYPSKWIVWPHSKSKGWLEQIQGNIMQ